MCEQIAATLSPSRLAEQCTPVMTWPTPTQMWQQSGTERAMDNRTQEGLESGSVIQKKAAWRCGLCGRRWSPCCSHRTQSDLPLQYNWARGHLMGCAWGWVTSPQLWFHAALLNHHQTAATEPCTRTLDHSQNPRFQLCCQYHALGTWHTRCQSCTGGSTRQPHQARPCKDRSM